jgi:putative oxidoreductase
VAGGALIAQGIASESLFFKVVAIADGALLLAGLWTPIAGSVAVALELWNIVAGTGDLWANILLGSMAIALALVGPGAWSVDAWLFGWKRFEIRDRHPR